MYSLLRRLLSQSSMSVTRPRFVEIVLTKLVELCRCDRGELWLEDEGSYSRYWLVERPSRVYRYRNGYTDDLSGLREAMEALERGELDPARTSATPQGSLFLTHTSRWFRQLDEGEPPGPGCLAMIPIWLVDVRFGVIRLEAYHEHLLAPGQKLEELEQTAQMVGLALTNVQAQMDLCERIKELTCLYEIANLEARTEWSKDKLLQGIVELLPRAWQHPEIACAQIMVDGRYYRTPAFQEGAYRQRADIVVEGQPRGFVEVTYTTDEPFQGGAPFLKWEERLIESVGQQVALIIGRRQMEEERIKLQDQLRHADRLATIGQLAAGVAHELNEPLTNILGFAQLAQKTPEVPDQTKRDLQSIETASLHAREVIRKLMIFARQIPQRNVEVDLNKVVEEGMYFLTSRCSKAGVEVVQELSPDLPRIEADPSQLNQVLVNLVVNAIQAMPHGGTLTVRTTAADRGVTLVVEDTGCGMSAELQRQIFIPFFTTKDIDQGTGLGLPVVHGIVTAHRGSIELESDVGLGTRFTVSLPAAPPAGDDET